MSRHIERGIKHENKPTNDGGGGGGVAASCDYVNHTQRVPPTPPLHMSMSKGRSCVGTLYYIVLDGMGDGGVGALSGQPKTPLLLLLKNQSENGSEMCLLRCFVRFSFSLVVFYEIFI